MAQHHPLGDIEYLRENLLNSYKLGFPILKELVQNAEDAKATHLDYGWVEGLSSADHPLLRSPALFMLDNGDFTEDNAKAIRYILGGSSKPNQQDSIGKFGLGLKSVFHLCEAFFYIAPPIPNSKYKSFGLFNPWAGAENKDDYHDNWDDFSDQDIVCIKKAVKKILDKDIYQKKWFILWIPLRQECHKTNEKEEDGIELGCIKNGQDDFFDTKIPEFLDNKDTQQQLSLLLPLLSNIKEIRYWEKSLKKTKFEIKLGQGTQRHPNFSDLPINQNRDITGQIYIAQKRGVSFSGFEIIIDSPELNNIQQSPELPTKFKHIKPHCAIIFSQLENVFSSDESKLFFRTAVFLPINEDQDNKCETKQSYYVTLHGYFFVDFARTGILGWDKDKWLINSEKLKDDDSVAYLKKRWNFYLYKGLLYQLLQSLQQAVIQLKLSQDEVKAICKTLKNSLLLKYNSNNIFVQYQFIDCVHPDTNQTGWRLLDVNHKVLKLPNVDVPVPDWDVFSYLKKLTDDGTYFTLSNSPNLCPKNKPDQWSEQDILDFLSFLSPEIIFTKKEHITYLESFLKESCKNKLSSKIQEKLAELLRKGLSMEIAEDLRESIKLLISLIDTNKLYVIDCDQDILQSIYKLELEVLVISQEFYPNPKQEQNSNQLDSANDAISILKCLTNMLENGGNQEKQSQIYELIKSVLEGAKKHLKTILQECHNLRILEGDNLKTSQRKLYSLSEIQASNFFAKSGDNKLARLLQEALANQEVILINKKIAEILKPVFTLKDSSSCLKLLSNNTQLSEPQNRINLLKELLKNV